MPDPGMALPDMSIVKVSIDEMIVRLLEAYWDQPRPEDRTAQEIIDILEPAEFDRLRRMALVAIDHIIMCHVEAVGAENVRVMRPSDPRH